MKKILIALLVLAAKASYGQDCATLAANKPSISVRFQDEMTQSGAGPKVTMSMAGLKPQLGKAENWIKGILKNFTGAKLAYSNEYYFDLGNDTWAEELYNATGIKGFYAAKMRFYAYYCYENNNKIFTESESGSFVQIHFNSVFGSGLCKEAGVYTVNGKYAFEIFAKTRTEGRIDYYERIAMANDFDTIYKSKSDVIIIRDNDQPLFIKITRKEYLGQLFKDVEAYKNSEVATAKANYNPANEAANKAQLDAELKRIDNSKSYTPEQMAPYRKRLIETWETEKQKFDKRMAGIETDVNGAREALQVYMNKPQEWLNRSFNHFYSYSSYSAKNIKKYCDDLDVSRYSPEEETGTLVVSLNPDYYNKSLGADVPQLIVVQVTKGSYAHMKKVAELIKRPGALAPLEAILTPGKK